MTKTTDRQYYTPERLGLRQSTTPEGYLLCESVPIARTGQMIYSVDELPLEGGRDGLIYVDRDSSVVFDPVTIASFEGKPITNNHPDEMVGPENHKALSVGTVMNVRPGEGNDSHLLLADFLITDAAAIKDVQTGKHEVSAGYDADYEQDEPGKARQTKILGNHVALVDRGRCGPMCSIQDEAPKFMTKKAKVSGVLDRLFHLVLGTSDKTTIEREFAKVKDELGELAEEGDGKSDSDKEIHIHLNGMAAGPAAKADEPDPTEDEVEADPVAMLNTKVDKLAEIVAKLVGAEKKEGEAAAETAASHEDLTEDEDPEDEGDPAGDDPDDDMTKDEDPDLDDETGKKADEKMTKDSAHIVEMRKTIALAEILSPGIKPPTFDAKITAQGVKDAVCILKRRALRRAMTGDKAKVVKQFVGDADVKSASCDAVSVMFRLAAEAVGKNNNEKMAPTTDDAFIKGTRAVQSLVKDINAKNRDFWAAK